MRGYRGYHLRISDIRSLAEDGFCGLSIRKRIKVKASRAMRRRVKAGAEEGTKVEAGILV